MEYGVILIAILIITFWIIYDKFLKSDGSKDFTNDDKYKSTNTTFNSLNNANKNQTLILLVLASTIKN